MELLSPKQAGKNWQKEEDTASRNYRRLLQLIKEKENEYSILITSIDKDSVEIIAEFDKFCTNLFKKRDALKKELKELESKINKFKQ